MLTPDFPSHMHSLELEAFEGTSLYKYPMSSTNIQPVIRSGMQARRQPYSILYLLTLFSLLLQVGCMF